jgi:glycosyltransferase involved in cell wall biosynthesis
MRAVNLADALVKKGHTVTLWSSDFFHQEKRHRYGVHKKIKINDSLRICLIPSPGYMKNIGLSRVIDHLCLASNLKRILYHSSIACESELPDVAFIGYPPIEAANIMNTWLVSKGIPTVLDIKDYWPRMLVEAFPKVVQPLARLALDPYFRIARQVIKNASALTSITETFLVSSAAIGNRTVTNSDSVLYLAPNPALIEESAISISKKWWKGQGIDFSNTKCFTFIGSLSRSFEFALVKEAFEQLMRIDPAVILIICGDGEQKEELNSLFENIPNVFLPGRVTLAQIDVVMKNTLAFVAPYKNTSDFRMSVPNKIIDSISYGVPIISGLKGEVMTLINANGIGFACENTKQSWFNAMYRITIDLDVRARMAENCSNIYQAMFSYDAVYGQFVNKLEKLINEK